MRNRKRLAAVMLIFAFMLGTFAGCGSGAPKDLALEPCDIAWGATQQEAGDLLKYVYRTNERNPGYIYVLNDDNGDSIQAFGAAPEVIIYDFNFAEEGSDESRLGAVYLKYQQDDYDTVLASLEKNCGERYFEDPQWGTTDSNVYLFEDSTVCIEYSSRPLVDPETVDEDSRDRYIWLSGMTYSGSQDLCALIFERFSMLGMYSTADTDFTVVDNSQ